MLASAADVRTHAPHNKLQDDKAPLPNTETRYNCVVRDDSSASHNDQGHVVDATSHDMYANPHQHEKDVPNQTCLQLYNPNRQSNEGFCKRAMTIIFLLLQWLQVSSTTALPRCLKMQLAHVH
eukprot:2623890-Amphidinium_carterae.1